MKRKYIVHLVAGARPNFMKIAPLYHALNNHNDFQPAIIYTGQHYDFSMAGSFFHDLELPEPEINLGVGSASHAVQTGKIMIAYEAFLKNNPADWVVVVGDVNSTMACTLVAKKMGNRVAHLEAGLRSFDRSMPEEVNRIVTDSLTDLHWTPSADASKNLLREGINKKSISFVGNIMIDSLIMCRKKIEIQETWKSYAMTPGQFGIVTIHRPSNTDDTKRLIKIFSHLDALSESLPFIIPLHPRTKKRLSDSGFALNKSGLRFIEPQPYFSFMSLLTNAKMAITDSGGIQEETTYLNIPCLTLRNNTERPITCSKGTNQLVSLENLETRFSRALEGKWKKSSPIKFWDGKTAERITADLLKRSKSLDR